MEVEEIKKLADKLAARPFYIQRKKSSPRVNDFDLYVMNKCEQIRKKKDIHNDDVLPMFDKRYYTLLRDGDRKLYAMQLYLLAEGLGVTVDDLVSGYDQTQ